MIAVAADSKFKNLKDLVEAGRRDPNAISCAIASATGFGRFVLYVMERDMGAKFKYVSFKSGTEAALAVVGGHVPFTTERRERDFRAGRRKKIAHTRRDG